VPGDQVHLSGTSDVSGKQETVRRFKFDGPARQALDVASRATPFLATVLFLSDLDGTWLSPDKENRKALDEGVQELKHEAAAQGVDLQFGYISARPLPRILQEDLPEADWTVANNGGYVYEGDPTGNKAIPAQDWEAHKHTFGFSADRAFELAEELLQDPRFSGLEVSSVGTVVNNPAADACKEIATLCIRNDSIQFEEGESLEQLQSECFEAPRQVEAFAQALTQQLQAEGAKFEQSPVYPFHGKPFTMFDLACVDKGDAIEYLRDKKGLKTDHIIIAGDGGNDIAMMLDSRGQDDGRRAIVVGPNSSLREAAQKVQNALIQEANQDCSLAVLDGLRQHVQEILEEVTA
jgi:hydroxymethylpyrimidine pyrophosphatase-like HAD family hydrolase